jgi:hypothetical protein
MVLRVGTVTYGTKKKEEAFKEAFEPYFTEMYELEQIKNENSEEEE